MSNQGSKQSAEMIDLALRETPEMIMPTPPPTVSEESKCTSLAHHFKEGSITCDCGLKFPRTPLPNLSEETGSDAGQSEIRKALTLYLPGAMQDFEWQNLEKAVQSLLIAARKEENDRWENDPMTKEHYDKIRKLEAEKVLRDILALSRWNATVYIGDIKKYAKEHGFDLSDGGEK